uniref:Chemokine-like factor n=1 Tax=Rattus norvegicus TaxID=10116 RepID=A0A8I6A9V2_RAT
MDSPQKVVDHQPFCLSLKCFVKTLRLVVTVASMIFFIVAQAPEPYIVITGFEVTIILFLIALYMCSLDKTMRSFFWPLLVFGFLTVICTVADCALMCQKLRFRPHGPYQNRSATDVDDS